MICQVSNSAKDYFEKPLDKVRGKAKMLEDSSFFDGRNCEMQALRYKFGGQWLSFCQWAMSVGYDFTVCSTVARTDIIVWVNTLSAEESIDRIADLFGGRRQDP